ncbi:MAG: hypothetical protein QOK40_1687 [Miltoncostaeaceae bacterium]|nr:hypothetical protein [Miltoncostaeaceae bacterium]
MIAYVLVALVALVLIAVVGWPLIRPAPGESSAAPPDEERGRLAEEVDRSLTAIREIDFDHRAGHLSDDDFATLDGAERARTAELLRRLDRLDSA